MITIRDMLAAADAFAEEQGISNQVDVLDAVQFIVSNLHELGGFALERRRITIANLIVAYNAIVLAQETDPSLLISN